MAEYSDYLLDRLIEHEGSHVLKVVYMAETFKLNTESDEKIFKYLMGYKQFAIVRELDLMTPDLLDKYYDSLIEIATTDGDRALSSWLHSIRPAPLTNQKIATTVEYAMYA